MVNFIKLRRLINEYEYKKDSDKRSFFRRLKSIAEYEIGLRQCELSEWDREIDS